MNHSSTPQPERLIPRSVHPFPARMAASIPWKELRNKSRKRLRVLDPMAGSGTTLVVARALGHAPIGFDTDPLAVLLAKVWCSDLDKTALLQAAERVSDEAHKKAARIPKSRAYPVDADDETRKFVRYWFDDTNRRQLAALAHAIGRSEARGVRDALWCAFSRLIITKQAGASLALDVAHSRPHRVATKAVTRPIGEFLRSVRAVAAAAPFSGDARRGPPPTVKIADARRLPLDDSTVDVAISSPPYQNAIDYLRGHRLSLVWMGHSVDSLRQIRATNIGTEVGSDLIDVGVAAALGRMGHIDRLPKPQQRMLARYAIDMNQAVAEIARVLVPGGRALLVLGDCTIRGVFVRNSAAIENLAVQHGLQVVGRGRRAIRPNRRYLPPPSSKTAATFKKRMRAEVLLHLKKR